MIIKNSWSFRKDYIVPRTISTTRRFSRHAKVNSFSLSSYFYFLFNTEGALPPKNKNKKTGECWTKTSFTALKLFWSIFSTFQSIPNLILCKNTIIIPCMWNFSRAKVISVQGGKNSEYLKASLKSSQFWKTKPWSKVNISIVLLPCQ